MFATILGWFATKGLGAITTQISAWQERKAEAARLGNTIAVKEIEAKIAHLELLAELQASEPDNVKEFRAKVRAIIAGFPVGILIWKVLVNDMAFQQCGPDKWINCTPEPGTFVMTIVTAVIGWYFLFGRKT